VNAWNQKLEKKMKILFFLLAICLVTECATIFEETEETPENPYRAAKLRQLKSKVECIDCDPTEEELAEYHRLKEPLEVVTRRISYSNSWQNYSRTYYLYFPNNIKNPWYTPGSLGTVNGGRAPGAYYPYGSLQPGYYGRIR